MPFVNINLPASFTSEVKKQISLSIHESLMAIFNVPENDYFQVIHTLETENLIFPDNYFGVFHTSSLIYINIICANGRTVEMKKALYASIAQNISERTPVSPSDVIVVLNETPVENWSFGLGIAQMIK